MSISESGAAAYPNGWRLWPGAIIATLQCIAWFGVPLILPDEGFYGVIGAFAGGVAILIWWAFFSRAHRWERWGYVALMLAALYGTSQILHVSVATAGMGMLFLLYGFPLLSFIFVGAAVAAHRLRAAPRRVAIVAAILVACGWWAFVRIDGIRASGGLDLAWRWSPTPEERLLARSEDLPRSLPEPSATARMEELPAPAIAEPANEVEPVSSAPAIDEEHVPVEADSPPSAVQSSPPAASPPPAWPGFRGPDRNSVIWGVQIETDWQTSPPTELWRRAVGPGWSSFAVDDAFVYTQEQRGDHEIVSCYELLTGEPVWMHDDETRFWEANAGAGPRATPTLSNGRVYSFGATGILNALDARTGAVVWSRNAAADTETKTPHWGFSSSPLVVEDAVIVSASGQLAAYDSATGEPRWFGPEGGTSYSSPHLTRIAEVAQILLLSSRGATSVAADDGSLLWRHSWPGASIVQPALVGEGGVLFGAAGGIGMQRIAVSVDERGEWDVQERWSSLGLKPYFNDFVLHKGHAYGFDGGILASVDLEDGGRNWKGGRYGHGQLVLLPDQDLLLVSSESGELALVAAAPDAYSELARFPAITGKSWNHPVLTGDILLVRNNREMVAFRLSLKDR